jgi:hypothetical protein
MKWHFAAACLCLPQVVLAQQLVGLRADRDRAAVHEPVKLVAEFTDAERVWCGLRVTFGDAEVREIRVEQIPVNMVKEYSAPGTYVVRAEGRNLFRGLISAGSCTGEAREVRIVVLDPVAEKQAEDRRREEAEKARALVEKERQVLEREAELERRERSALEQAQAEQAAKAKAAKAAKATAATKTAPTASKASAPSSATASGPAASQPKDGTRKVF